MLTTLLEAPITRGTRVLLRSNLNVPLDGGRVVDASRLRESLATIEFLRERGAQTVIIGHLSKDPTFKPVFEELAKHIPVAFAKTIKDAEKIKINTGEFVLVENLRTDEGEEKNSVTFAKKLSLLGDVFVNDDFTSAHRKHASVVGVPKLLPSFMGLRFAEELEHLSKAFEPMHPAVLILGGAKSETKLPIALSFADVMDTVFVAGVSGNALLRAQGRNVGESVVGEAPREVLAALLAKNNVHAYSDALVTDADGDEIVVSIDALMDDNAIVDAGPETTARIADAVSRAKFVLWNGPLGLYEKGYTAATHEVAKALASSSAEGIVGGGDTRAAIASLGFEEKITFMSSAGGAMLEFLANKTLPGIDALKKSA